MLAMLVHSSTALIPPSGNQRWKQSEHPAKKRSMCNLWLLRKKSATSASTLKRSRASGASWTHTHTHKLHLHQALSSQAKATRSTLWQVVFMDHNRVAWEELDLGSSLGRGGRRNDTQMLTFTLSLSPENTNPHTPLSSTLRTSHQREGSAQQDRGGQSLGPDTLTAHRRAPQHSLTYWVWWGSGAARRCSAPVYGHFFLFCFVFFCFSFFSFKLEGWTHVRKSDKRAENRGETLKLKKRKKKKNWAAVRVSDSQITLPWIMKMRRWPRFILVFSAVISWKLENTTCILSWYHCRSAVFFFFFMNDCFLWVFFFLYYVLLCDYDMLWYSLIQHCVQFRFNICSIYCPLFS